MKKISWFLFFSIIGVSCLDEGDCFQLNNNIVVLNFRILGGGSDAVRIFGVQSPATDSVFIGSGLVTAAELPLNPLENETDFLFQGIDGPQALDLSYKSQIQFVSADCGERYIFSDLKIENHDFDSVRVVNTTPTRPASSNIDIYRCPRTELMGIEFTTGLVVKTITTDYMEVIYLVNDTLATVSLPVNTMTNATTFTFELNDGTNKKLTVNYQVTAKTLVALCGEQRFISELNYDASATDFVTTLSSDSIHDLPITNFEITP